MSAMDCLHGSARRATALETAKTCHKTPALLAYRVRCGKATCRCAREELHGPYWFLRWREGARHRRRYVPAGELPAVRAVIERRRAHDRAARRDCAAALAMLRGWKRWLTEIERNP